MERMLNPSPPRPLPPDTEPPAPTHGWLRPLDGIRCLLTFIVMFGHLFGFAGYPLAGAVNYCVPAFFTLSGFVLYFSSAGRERIELNRPFAAFFRRRMTRLMPAYLFAVFFAIGGTLLLISLKKIPARIVDYSVTRSLLWHLPMFHTWSKEYLSRPNPALWMMGFELQMSLCVPLILAGARRIGWAGVFLLALALHIPIVDAINHAFYNTPYLLVGFFEPSFTFCFILGMASARLSRRWEAARRSAWRRALFLTALVALAAVAAYTPRISAGVFLPGAEAIGLFLAALCIYGVLSPTSVFGRAMSVAPMRFIAKISYSIFLLHFPILYWTNLYAFSKGFPLSKALPFVYAPGVAAVILLSWLSYTLLEAPFQNEKSRRRD